MFNDLPKIDEKTETGTDFAGYGMAGTMCCLSEGKHECAIYGKKYFYPSSLALFEDVSLQKAHDRTAYTAAMTRASVEARGVFTNLYDGGHSTLVQACSACHGERKYKDRDYWRSGKNGKSSCARACKHDEDGI